MGLLGTTLEWFSRREHLAAARQRVSERSDWQLTCIRRADTCLRFANRLPDAIESRDALAPEVVGAYRLAYNWLLASEIGEPCSITEAMPRARQDWLEESAGDAAKLQEIRSILERSIFDDAVIPNRQLHREAEQLRSFVRAIRADVDPVRATRRLVLQRTYRMFGLVVLAALGAAAILVATGRIPRPF